MMSIGLLLAILQASKEPETGTPPYRCPDTIQVSEKLAQPQGGWTESVVSEPHRLMGLTIFDGDPAERASLVGDERKISKTEWQTTWPLKGERPFWISCSYANTGVAIARPLDKALTSCTAKYSRAVLIGGLPEIRAFVCK